MALKVGDKIETWFSDSPDGKSVVLAVHPYTGHYPMWFTHTVRVVAPRTRRGWMELSVHEHEEKPARADLGTPAHAAG